VYFTERTEQQTTRLVRWTGLTGLATLLAVTGCSTTEQPAAPVAAPLASSGALPPPSAVRNWNEVRAQAARRMVAANPGATYTGEVPEPLLAIPVLEVELNGDGSVRRVEVMRKPSQATDTIKLATDAVYRAAPYGDVSRLPKPWRFSETFLFNDDRKFKPRTLDQ
jgi:hypothetical protein